MVRLLNAIAAVLVATAATARDANAVVVGWAPSWDKSMHGIEWLGLIIFVIIILALIGSIIVNLLEKLHDMLSFLRHHFRRR